MCSKVHKNGDIIQGYEALSIQPLHLLLTNGSTNCVLIDPADNVYFEMQHVYYLRIAN